LFREEYLNKKLNAALAPSSAAAHVEEKQAHAMNTEDVPSLLEVRISYEAQTTCIKVVSWSNELQPVLCGCAVDLVIMRRST
jgi:hypothetical protein